MMSIANTEFSEADVNEFFAEINSLCNNRTYIPENVSKDVATDIKQSSPQSEKTEILSEPKTSWVVQVDESTGYTFYWNSDTGQSTWEIPEEYTSYLEKYETFCANTAKLQGGDCAKQETGIPPPPPPLEVSKHVQEASKVADESVEYLSEYIAYSDTSSSSGESSDSDSDVQTMRKERKVKRQSQSGTRGYASDKKRRKKTVHSSQYGSSQTYSDNPQVSDAMKSSSSDTSAFIGPQLPLASTNRSGIEKEIGDEDAGGVQKKDVGPCRSMFPENEIQKQMALAEEQLNETVRDVAQTIFDKLAFLDISVENSASVLHVLLVQIQTRMEDWKSGNLTTEYYLSKLTEAQRKMTSYEEGAIPDGWTCHWDTELKRYFYENCVTGESQWEFPMEPAAPTVRSSSSVDKYVTKNGSKPSAKEEGEIDEENDALQTLNLSHKRKNTKRKRKYSSSFSSSSRSSLRKNSSRSNSPVSPHRSEPSDGCTNDFGVETKSEMTDLSPPPCPPSMDSPPYLPSFSETKKDQTDVLLSAVETDPPSPLPRAEDLVIQDEINDDDMDLSSDSQSEAPKSVSDVIPDIPDSEKPLPGEDEEKLMESASPSVDVLNKEEPTHISENRTRLKSKKKSSSHKKQKLSGRKGMQSLVQKWKKLHEDM